MFLSLDSIQWRDSHRNMALMLSNLSKFFSIIRKTLEGWIFNNPPRWQSAVVFFAGVLGNCPRTRKNLSLVWTCDLSNIQAFHEILTSWKFIACMVEQNFVPNTQKWRQRQRGKQIILKRHQCYKVKVGAVDIISMLDILWGKKGFDITVTFRHDWRVFTVSSVLWRSFSVDGYWKTIQSYRGNNFT